MIISGNVYAIILLFTYAIYNRNMGIILIDRCARYVMTFIMLHYFASTGSCIEEKGVTNSRISWNSTPRIESNDFNLYCSFLYLVGESKKLNIAIVSYSFAIISLASF